jgi:phenylacetate-coenzyme A ligase PaaK-like adenylate-forming protein
LNVAREAVGNMTLANVLTYLGALLRLRRNARLTRRQFEAERLLRFRDLVRHAQQHSRYYAAIMRARGLAADTCLPTDFPILTKRLLRDNFDDIVTDRRLTCAGIMDFLQHSRDPEERYLGEFVVLHTSGSSGEVGYFVFSSPDWMRGIAGLARVNRLRLGRKRVAFYGATGGHFGGISWTVTARQGVGRFFFAVETLDINAPLDETLARLNAVQPHVLAGYATGHKILATAKLAGRLRICPEVLESGGEPLSIGDQAWLEEVFGCPCINVYGATESMLMGVARLGDPGMTLFDDQLIVEPAADHVLVTNLFNRTLPLIRYRMNDTLRLTKLRSPYGHYPVIEPVVGRNEWVPVFRNALGEADFISPLVINEIFVPGVWRFQMRWIDETAFRFAICLDTGLDVAGRATALSAIESRLHEILGQRGLSNVHFGVDVVDDIAVDPVTRKFRLVLPHASARA